MRLIDADALLDALDKSAIYGWSLQEDAAARRWAERVVELMPSAQPNLQQTCNWIPVTERLPEASGAYLVTCANGNVKVGHFATFDGKWTDAKAVAWMPLPELYEE